MPHSKSPKVLWDVVRAAAARANIDKLAPHDLRRTCARLCHLAGGELDQIQFLLSTFRFRPRNATWDASRSSAVLSTTRWASSRNASRDSCPRTMGGRRGFRPTLGD